MAATTTTEPVPLNVVCAMFDPVAHYLGHLIDEVRSGEEIPTLTGSPSNVSVALFAVCEAMGEVIRLIESGSLTMLAVSDEETTEFRLSVPGLS